MFFLGDNLLLKAPTIYEWPGQNSNRRDLDLNLSRCHYSWEVNSRMTYLSIRNLGKGTQVWTPWTVLIFFLDFIFSLHDIGTLNWATTSTFYLYFSPWIPLLFYQRVVGSNPHNPFLFFRLKFVLSCSPRPRGCGIEPPQPLFILFFISLELGGCGFKHPQPR